jgi:TerC family integral membrane protein
LPLSLASIDFGPWHWAAFVGFMLLASAVDLGLGRRGKAMSTKSALMWCGVWITLALTFNGWLAYHDLKKGEEFFQGYLLEYSLSVDNLFVFVLVFGYFKTPSHLQHRALVWGIIGAMILRASMILVGAALIQKWQWVLVLFGLFLVYSGIKMLFHDDDEDPSQSKLIQFLQNRLPLADGYREDKFLVHEPVDPAVPAEKGGAVRMVFTRLFLVVLVIEASDVIFAVDSVPAIFGVTKDPFVVFTSNMFAILGLRSLFFALSGAIQHLKYLNYGLSIVLCFIGLKMCAAEGPTFIDAICGWTGQARPDWLPTHIVDGVVKPHGYHMETWHSLAVICTLLGITVAVSLIFRPKAGEEEGGPLTTSSSSHDLPVVGSEVDDAPLSSSSTAPATPQAPSDEATSQSPPA